MLKDIVISAEGLAFLERIMRSCPPRNTNGGIPVKKKLHELSMVTQDIISSYLLEELGSIPGGIFESIFKYAKETGVELIDENFIVDYFSGKPHTDEISRKLEEGGVSLSAKDHPLYAEMILVSHTLLCVELSGNEDNGFFGIYRNGDISFSLTGLIPFREDLGSLHKGNMVWAHLSSMVSVRVDLELAKFSLDIQRKNGDFLRACKKMERIGINNKALGYHDWANKAYGLFYGS